MPVDPARVEEIFAEAVAETDAAKRAAYLDRACGDDRALHERVEALLAAHEAADSFLPLPELVGTTAPFVQLSEGPGTTIGRYKLLEQIGEGGFGVVFMAEQDTPIRRRVALKVIKLGMDTKQVVARFEAERQALALMDHPNIARVLDAGATDTGRPYFVMELVRGIPITEYCDKHVLSIPQRLELFQQVCQAVQHAHQKGLIHRDLKPTNVLVSTQDDRPVVKVIDFGVAKAIQSRLTEKTLFTEFRQLIGTPAYMSPEQAEGGLDVDTRSDVYSLGVLLYELLAGTPPFSPIELRSKAFAEMQRIIREVEPPSPSARLSTLTDTLPSVAAQRAIEPGKLAATVRGELDWIVMRALEKDRTRRYQTASGFAADVERYLHDEPVQACPPSLLYQIGKFARRNKPALVTATIIAASLLLGTIVSIWQATVARRAERLARDQQQVAQEQKALAEDRAQTARRNLYATTLSLADVAWERGHVGQMLELLEDQRPAVGKADLRGFEWYHLWNLCHRGLLFTLRGHADTVRSLTFSPDGTTLASGSSDGSINLWNLASGKLQTSYLSYLSPVCCVAFSADGKRLCAGRDDGNVELWDVASEQLRITLNGHSKPAVAASFSPDGTTLYTGDSLQLKRWNLATAREEATIDTGKGLGSPALLPNDDVAATAGFEKVHLWDLKSARSRATIGDLRWWPLAVALSPDGKFVAAGSRDESIVKIWDIETGKVKSVLRGHTKAVLCLTFSPDGTRLATGSSDGTAKVWSLATGQHQSYGHILPVYCVAFSPDGKWLASGSSDRSIKLWDLQMERTRPRLPLQTGLIWVLSFSPDNQRFASISYNDNDVKIWDASTGALKATIVGPAGAGPSALAYSPNGRWLAAGGGDMTVRVWDTVTGQVVATVEPLAGHVHALTFSPDGKLLAAAGTCDEVKLWDAVSWEQRARYQLPGWCWNLAFSPDSRRLAATGKQVVTIWDVDIAKEMKLEWTGDGSYGCTSLAFSPDGRMLATLTGDYSSYRLGTEVTYWDVNTGLEQKAVGQSPVLAVSNCLAFSPDWKYLAVGNTDGSVGLFDGATGQKRVTLTGRQGQLSAIAFSGDGRTLVTGDMDGTIELWHTATEAEVLQQSGRPN